MSKLRPLSVTHRGYIIGGGLRQVGIIIIPRPKSKKLGSGCGSVGRAVASDTRDPHFKSNHQLNLIYTIKCIKIALKRRN